MAYDSSAFLSLEREANSIKGTRILMEKFQTFDNFSVFTQLDLIAGMMAPLFKHTIFRFFFSSLKHEHDSVIILASSNGKIVWLGMANSNKNYITTADVQGDMDHLELANVIRFENSVLLKKVLEINGTYEIENSQLYILLSLCDVYKLFINLAS